ncbi:MAG TPA: hypothetical protein PKD55_05775 [Bellilinea sp.]|nr:hypothetical protein [Bellilinea sp.]
MDDILTAAKEVTELKSRTRKALEQSQLFPTIRPGREKSFDAELAQLSGCATFEAYQEYARGLRRSYMELEEASTRKALNVEDAVDSGKLDAETKNAVLNEMRKW